METPKEEQPLPEDIKVVRHHLNALSEHFDTVEILVSRFEGKNGTRHLQFGTGNYFARYGHLMSHLSNMEESLVNRPEDDEDTARNSGDDDSDDEDK